MRPILIMLIFCLTLTSACRKSSGTPSSPSSSDSAKYVSVSFMGAALISPPSPLEFSVAASRGSKMVFSGAADEYAQVNSDSAYVYDTVSRQWSKFRIGAAHTWGTAVACDGKIFLAGGDSGSIMWPTAPVTIDIYDIASGQWSTARLNSAPPVVAAGAGTKIVFAGGYDKLLDDVDNVDIYDVTTKHWSTAALSAPRGVISAAAAGTKLIFAGGWTASALNIGHSYSCTVGSGNMALFAGGVTPNGQDNANDLPYFNIDVYNATTGTWGSTPLPTANPNRVVGSAPGSQVLFAYCPDTYKTPDSVEIYHLQ
jgi:N-acetylneuraminic acid mutarotase